MAMTEDISLLPRGEEPPEADFSLVITDSAMEPLIPRGSRVYVSSRSPLREMETGLFLCEGRVLCRRWCEDYNGALILLGGDESRREDSIYLDREQRRRCLCLGKVLI